MSPLDAVRGSLRRLGGSWLESALIVLAIALGVAVLVVVAAVLGARLRALSNFDESLAARGGVVRQAADPFGAFSGAGSEALDVRQVGTVYTPSARFGFADLSELKAAAPSVDFAYVRAHRVFRTAAWDGSLPATAVSADYLEAARLAVVAGSVPTASDFEAERKVIVLTERFASLLGLEEPFVGRQVEFVGEDAAYTVVGVLPPVADGEPINAREALVPFRPRQDPVEQLWFAVEDAASLEPAVAEVGAFVEARWEGAAAVSVDRETVRAHYREQNARGLVLAFFGAVALIVAACNILALMLARVMRRQRDIGIERALGGTRADVAFGVVLDSGSLGLLGAAVGVLLGRGLLAMYNVQLAADPAAFAVRFGFDVVGALLSVALAVCLAVAAGLYPGMVAARMRSVEAITGG